MYKLKKGFSIIEVLLAGTIFALAISGIVAIIIYTQKNNQISVERDLSIKMLEEGSVAIKSIRDRDFNLLSIGNDMALNFNNNQWEIITSPNVNDDKQEERTRRVSIVAGTSSDVKNVTITVFYPINAKGGIKNISITENIVNTKREVLDDVTMQSATLKMILDEVDLEQTLTTP